MKKVIYTCLTGGYDKLEQPEVLDGSFDYICFTDDASAGYDGVWELRPILLDGDPVTRARYPKLQPHVVLPEYGLSVFMDANLCITDAAFYARINAASDKGIALLPHPERDCVYEELRYCYLKDKIGTRAAFAHLRRLKEGGLRRHAGLYENNVILRRHGEPGIAALDNAWWKAFRACCTRDQLTLVPVLHNLGVKPALLFGEGLNARNVPYLRYTLHPATGKENTPGRLTWGNVRYRLRLLYRKVMMLFLK